MSDAVVAVVARRLAKALDDCARSRSEDDKKRVAALHTELCSVVRTEETETAS